MTATACGAIIRHHRINAGYGTLAAGVAALQRAGLVISEATLSRVETQGLLKPRYREPICRAFKIPPADLDLDAVAHIDQGWTILIEAARSAAQEVLSPPPAARAEASALPKLNPGPWRHDARIITAALGYAQHQARSDGAVDLLLAATNPAMRDLQGMLFAALQRTIKSIVLAGGKVTHTQRLSALDNSAAAAEVYASAFLITAAAWQSGAVGSGAPYRFFAIEDPGLIAFPVEIYRFAGVGHIQAYATDDYTRCDSASLRKGADESVAAMIASMRSTLTQAVRIYGPTALESEAFNADANQSAAGDFFIRRQLPTSAFAPASQYREGSGWFSRHTSAHDKAAVEALAASNIKWRREFVGSIASGEYGLHQILDRAATETWARTGLVTDLAGLADQRFSPDERRDIIGEMIRLTAETYPSCEIRFAVVRDDHVAWRICGHEQVAFAVGMGAGKDAKACYIALQSQTIGRLARRQFNSEWLRAEKLDKAALIAWLRWLEGLVPHRHSR